MIKTKDSKGIALVTLILTVVLMGIISSTAIYTSYERFELNKLKKMHADIELLTDKVSNYYLKYDNLPIARSEDNSALKYTYSLLDFEKNKKDNETYYILDLSALDGIALNYGKEGFENLNGSDDVYIINEKSHTIYYVRGIEFKDIIYHVNLDDTDVNVLSDNIPPSKPEIKIVSGIKNEEGVYTTKVEIEIIQGKDNWSGVKETTSVITKDGLDITNAIKQNNLYIIEANGTYVISATTKDNSENSSTMETTIVVQIPENIS